jgi:hypothetical protein
LTGEKGGDLDVYEFTRGIDIQRRRNNYSSDIILSIKMIFNHRAVTNKISSGHNLYINNLCPDLKSPKGQKQTSEEFDESVYKDAEKDRGHHRFILQFHYFTSIKKLSE